MASNHYDPTVVLVETPSGSGFEVRDGHGELVAFVRWGDGLTQVEAMEVAHVLAARIRAAEWLRRPLRD